MEIREITFSFFTVILGIGWQAINDYNEMYVLYVFYMHFTFIVSVFMLSNCDTEINKSINQLYVDFEGIYDTWACWNNDILLHVL